MRLRSFYHIITCLVSCTAASSARFSVAIETTVPPESWLLPRATGCCRNQQDTRITACTCANGTADMKNLFLGTGERRVFHWRLHDITVGTRVLRPALDVHLGACWGEFSLHINPLTSVVPTSSVARHHANTTEGDVSLRIPLMYADYLISVESILGGNFTFAAIMVTSMDSTVTDIPIPGAGGALETTQIDENKLLVKWHPAQSSSALEYQIYYRFEDPHLDRGSFDPRLAQLSCAEVNTALKSCPGTPAVMGTSCGMRTHGTLVDMSGVRQGAGGRLELEIAEIPTETWLYVNLEAATKNRRFQRAYAGALVRLSFGRVVSIIPMAQMMWAVGGGAGLVGIVVAVMSIAKRREMRRLSKQL